MEFVHSVEADSKQLFLFVHLEVNHVWFQSLVWHCPASDPAMADPVILTTYPLVPQDLKEIQYVSTAVETM